MKESKAIMKGEKGFPCEKIGFAKIAVSAAGQTTGVIDEVAGTKGQTGEVIDEAVGTEGQTAALSYKPKNVQAKKKKNQNIE